MYLYKNLEFPKNNFELQIKVGFHDVKNSKIWGQALTMCSSINVYLINEVLKTLAYHDSNKVLPLVLKT